MKKRYETEKPTNTIKLITKKWAVKKTDLVADDRINREMDNKGTRLQLDKLKAIIEKNMDRINDATGIMELLPDLNLVREILVASILSPKDLTEIKLTITADDTLVPPEVTEMVRKHFTGEYDLESKLSSILADALFNVGSYILLPIPAVALQTVMNSNATVLESLNVNDLTKFHLPNLGMVGHRQGVFKSQKDPVYAMESVADSFFPGDAASKGLIQITDNPLYLLGNTLVKARQQINIREHMQSIGMEGMEMNGVNSRSVYKNKMYDYVEAVMMKKVDLDKVGVNLDPIVLNLPTEAVIPVFVPGEPENHVGYYVVLDEYGNPLQASKNSNFFKELNDKLENTITSGGNTMVKTSLNVTEINKEAMASNFRQPIMDAYIQQLEQELRDSVKNGVYGENVEIARPAELYRLMFSRQLQKMQTRALYIPAEMMTYVAFDYDEMGIGISLIEKTKLYSSLRAILMFAEVMAGIKNSVPARLLEITLDEHDPDPQATIETVLNEFTALQTTGLPLGKLNPSEIVDALQRAGIQVKINGGDVFPNTSIEVQDKHREMTKPDTDLSELLKKQQYAGLGVSPELADRGLEGEFATGIAQANLLQTKRVMVWQEMYTTHLTDHVHKYIYAGGPLWAEIKAAWEKMEPNGRPSITEMVSALRVELPKPDTAIIVAQSAAYTDYSEFIELAVSAHINEDMLRPLLKGDFTPDAVPVMQKAVTDLMRRQYMRKQNILPELDGLLTSEENNTSELIVQHNEAILKLVAEVLPALYKKEYTVVDKKTAEAMKEVEEQKQKDDPDYEPDGGDGGSEGDTGDSGGDESGGGADMGGTEDSGDMDMTDLGMGGDEDTGDAGDTGTDFTADAETTGDETADAETTGDETAADETGDTTAEAEPAAAEAEATAEPAAPAAKAAPEPKAAAELKEDTGTEEPKDETLNEFGKPINDKDGNPITYDKEGNEVKEEPADKDKEKDDKDKKEKEDKAKKDDEKK